MWLSNLTNEITLCRDQLYAGQILPAKNTVPLRET